MALAIHQSKKEVLPSSQPKPERPRGTVSSPFEGSGLAGIGLRFDEFKRAAILHAVFAPPKLSVGEARGLLDEMAKANLWLETDKGTHALDEDDFLYGVCDDSAASTEEDDSRKLVSSSQRRKLRKLRLMGIRGNIASSENSASDMPNVTLEPGLADTACAPKKNTRQTFFSTDVRPSASQRRKLRMLRQSDVRGSNHSTAG
mmetsp:Transcript_32838/g.75082  ORF Transcript_32838/g.75082 Transcript_32838/m.75082 type:complete len:202 (+) Transcript_32838:94-699(+)|eukprot:CAMPEP_0114545670 /NCGR_PEP_ID=MMETSP0114-20121206/3532_1 /TAXON_ID=31324 /ORGANISM="Goniomonas sp, Strain m" /LENGTH=201 /DNA_ID=CAMNT_0001730129 /DNA_START=71 /DNA_END=676 /DNA_ORIENTATION=+